MRFLSGAVDTKLYGVEDFGFMLTPYMGNVLPAGQIWAADTGCFTHQDFDPERYLRWLADPRKDKSSCLFATAPDVPFDFPATLARSYPMFDRIRALGYKVALCLQNEAEYCEIPWSDIDAVFDGGTTEWKLSIEARRLMDKARERGKHVHMGRVNGGRRGRIAFDYGCDSIDGTCLKHGAEANREKVRAWVQFLNRQQSFF